MTAGRLRAASATAAAAVLALLVALLTPMTHGAFSADVTATTGAALNPWFGCSALASGTGTRALFTYGLGGVEGDGVAPDLSGSGHPGAFSTSAHFAQDASAPCRRDADGVWLPGGSTDLVTQQLPLPTNFAYETWFRSASPNRVLMSIELRGYGFVALVIDGSGGLALGGLGNEYLHATASVADDHWHHLVMNAGNGSLAFWLDGTMLPGNALNVPDGLSVYFHIGSGTPSGPSSVSGASAFDGQLRYASLYWTVLTPNEIAQHRAAGRAGPGPSTPPSAKPSASATPDATVTPSPGTTVSSAPEEPVVDPAPEGTAQPVAEPAQEPVEGTAGQPDISTTGEQAPSG